MGEGLYKEGRDPTMFDYFLDEVAPVITPIFQAVGLAFIGVAAFLSLPSNTYNAYNEVKSASRTRHISFGEKSTVFLNNMFPNASQTYNHYAQTILDQRRYTALEDKLLVNLRKTTNLERN